MIVYDGKLLIIVLNKLKNQTDEKMREIKPKKNIPYSIKFPLIRDKILPIPSLPSNKGMKLEKIIQKKNFMLNDIAKINKI
jgi:hypothetical protein